MAFVSGNALGVTLDTTHYSQMGIDIARATCILKERIRTIHFSDYLDGKTHLFSGNGNLDFVDLFRVLDLSVLHSITLECSVGLFGENAFKMERVRMADRLKTAKSRLHSWIEAAQQSHATDADKPRR